MNTNEFVQKVQMAILAVFSVLVMSSAGWAATYYVDATNGNDNNNGTSEVASWKTISKVNASSFQPSDNIIFKRGEIWRETLIVKSSGTFNNPIFFGAYGNGNDPIINGSDIFSNWNGPDENGHYYASCFTQPGQVFRNNSRLTTVINKADLDLNSEWWNDTANMRIYLYENPVNDVIEVSQRKNCLLVYNQDYITIKTIIFEKSNEFNIRVYSGYGTNDGITLNTITSRYSENAGVRFGAKVSSSSVVGSTFYENGGCGIFVLQSSNTGTGIIIARNTTYKNGLLQTLAGGIYVYDSYKVIVENNLVYEESQNGGAHAGNGIWFDESNNGCIARYNLVRNNDKNGIFVEAMTNKVEIYYNISYSNAKAGISISSSSNRPIQNHEIYNNVSFNNSRFGIVVGMVDFGCMDCVKNNIIKNNIAFGNLWRELWAANGGENDGINGSGNVYTNNCFGEEHSDFILWGTNAFKSAYKDWEISYCGSYLCSNSVESDPLFNDAMNGDFRLKKNSQCIDNGTNVFLTEDYWGNGLLGSIWDIGAYEYQKILSPKNLRILKH